MRISIKDLPAVKSGCRAAHQRPACLLPAEEAWEVGVDGRPSGRSGSRGREPGVQQAPEVDVDHGCIAGPRPLRQHRLDIMDWLQHNL